MRTSVRVPTAALAALAALGATCATGASVVAAPATVATGPASTSCHGWAVGRPAADRATKVHARVVTEEDLATTGWVTVVVERVDQGHSAERRLWFADAAEGGTFRLGRLRPGRYVGAVWFDPKPTSEAGSCAATFELRVRRAG